MSKIMKLEHFLAPSSLIWTKFVMGSTKFNSSEAVVLQYVDDILLCAETEEACLQASEDFLNFLAGCGCKASREKAQLCQQLVINS